MPYEVRTPVFAGDLELLTQLVSRQEIDILELCLSALVSAFLAERADPEDGTGPADLETTTEFAVLAATLVELKSRRLLQERERRADEEDLLTPEDRDLLVARLLQGLTFREAARALLALMQAADRSVPRTLGPEDPLAEFELDPLRNLTAAQLRDGLLRALAPRPVVDLYHVTPIRASVADAIDRVVGELVQCQQLSLFDLNATEPDPLEVIVRFLAVLELCKRGVIEIEQRDAFGDVVVRSARPAADQAEPGPPVEAVP